MCSRRGPSPDGRGDQAVWVRRRGGDIWIARILVCGRGRPSPQQCAESFFLASHFLGTDGTACRWRAPRSTASGAGESRLRGRRATLTSLHSYFDDEVEENVPPVTLTRAVLSGPVRVGGGPCAGRAARAQNPGRGYRAKT